MATFGEVAYAIQDFAKTIHDDSAITLDHIIMQMAHYRNYILNANIGATGKQPSEANYQTICVEMQRGDDGDICGGRPYIISTEKVPVTMNLGGVRIMPPAGFMHGWRFQLVNYDKFQYVGHNKYLYGLTYATIGPDGRLYITSNNSGYRHLTKLRMTAIFNDVREAAGKECTDSCDMNVCDIEEKHFPLEDAYLPTLMQVVVNEVVGAAWRPKDDTNNAADDLAKFAQVLQRYTNNAFRATIKPNQQQQQ